MAIALWRGSLERAVLAVRHRHGQRFVEDMLPAFIALRASWDVTGLMAPGRTSGSRAVREQVAPADGMVAADGNLVCGVHEQVVRP